MNRRSLLIKLGNCAWRFSECGEVCLILKGACHHLYCYQITGKVILDTQLFGDFTQPSLTLSKPTPYSRSQVVVVAAAAEKRRSRTSLTADHKGRKCALSLRRRLTYITSALCGGRRVSRKQMKGTKSADFSTWQGGVVQKFQNFGNII